MSDNKERNFVATNILVVKNEKVLLGRKEEKIGAGRYNGPGGEVEEFDPDIEFRATLEMWDEIGLICEDDDLQKVAIGYFSNIKEDGSIFLCEVHFYIVEKIKCTGVPKATSEMGQPKWFYKNNIPLDEMMAADRFLLPDILNGKKVIIRATLKNKQSEIVGVPEITYVDSFE
jgi:ADP-ribose pyrophosphatase YjhB (NUDIX family)